MIDMIRSMAALLPEREIDIASLLNSEDKEDRRRALIEIAVRDYAEYFEWVIELMLFDPMDDVREMAAWALDGLNDSQAFPALIEAIHDRSFGVRSAAGWALVHLGAEVVQADMKRLEKESDNAGAREMARLVLQYL